MCNEDVRRWRDDQPFPTSAIDGGDRVARTGRFTTAKTAPCMRAWVGHRRIVDTAEWIKIP